MPFSDIPFKNVVRDVRYFLAAFVVVQLFLLTRYNYDWLHTRTDSAVVVANTDDAATSAQLPKVTIPEGADLQDEPLQDEKLGYVTWLGKTGDGSDKEDVYFLATRILVYQLLHAPATKSPRGLPIIVMVTPDVVPANRLRLENDGATVVPIEFVEEGQDWVKPRRKTWLKIMSKLRAWQLTDYSRLLMLDGDMLLRRPLDSIFDEVNATFVDTLPATERARKSDEASLPARYVFAGGPEVNGAKHHYPPSRENADFIHPDSVNLGFVMFSPSKELYDHYISILKIPNRFNSATMEQSLLNYAHRADGGMPWQELPPTYNIRSPIEDDIVGNVASLHDKWWLAPSGYPALHNWYLSMKKEMDAFYAVRDQAKLQQSRK